MFSFFKDKVIRKVRKLKSKVGLSNKKEHEQYYDLAFHDIHPNNTTLDDIEPLTSEHNGSAMCTRKLRSSSYSNFGSVVSESDIFSYMINEDAVTSTSSNNKRKHQCISFKTTTEKKKNVSFNDENSHPNTTSSSSVAAAGVPKKSGSINNNKRSKRLSEQSHVVFDERFQTNRNFESDLVIDKKRSNATIVISEEDVHMIFSKVRHNRIDEVHRIIGEEGVESLTDITDDKGNSLLHICTQNNLRKMSCILMTKYSGMVQVNYMNKKGKTALDYCIHYKFDQLTDYVRSIGGVSS